MTSLIVLVSLLFLSFSPVPEKAELFKKIDDNTFEIIVDEESDIPYTKVAVEGNHVVLLGKEDKITFPTPEKVKKESILGFFYVYMKDEDFEQSEVIHRKANTYDYRSISLYHDTKEYDRIMDEDNVPYAFLKGCIIIEDGYFYVVQKVEKDKVHYIDCYGEKFVEEKLKNQKLLKIPFGYKGFF